MGVRNLRTWIMTKIPKILVEKLAEQNVKVNVSIDPSPSFEDPPLKKLPNPIYNMFFHVVARDRAAIAAQLDSMLLRFGFMSQASFLKLVQDKMYEEVPNRLKEKLGNAVSFSVRTAPDSDAGAENKESFWLLVYVNSIDISALFRNIQEPKTS